MCYSLMGSLGFYNWILTIVVAEACASLGNSVFFIREMYSNMCRQKTVDSISYFPPKAFLLDSLIILLTHATITSLKIPAGFGPDGADWPWSSFISPSVCLNLLPDTKC